MNDVRTTRALILTALILGVAGDQLLDVREARAGFAIFAFAVLGATYARVRRPALRLLLALMGATALLQLVRFAPTLNLISQGLFVGGGVTALWVSGGGALIGARAWDLLRVARSTALTFIAGAARLLSQWRTGATADRTTPLQLILGGAVLALPLLAIITSLLSEADPIFARGMQAIVDFVSGDLVSHALTSAILAWIVAGWLQGMLRPVEDRAQRTDAPRFALAAHLPALLGFILLLAAFLGVQARTLFGGAEFVRRTAGLSFAEYARGGFFELVAVAFLAVGLLLIVDATLDRASEGAERRFRASGWTLIGLVGVLALSALHRMSVYVGAFGLSEDRIYALAAMAGIAASLAWFGATVLRGRGDRLIPGLLGGAVIWVFGLHALDPDALVARVNLSRAREGASFDIAYHVARSADAVPVLMGGARELGTPRCGQLVSDLAARWAVSADQAADWRAWNLALWRARRDLRGSSAELLRRRCGP